MTQEPGSAVPFAWFEGWLVSLKIAQIVVHVRGDQAGVRLRLAVHGGCGLRHGQRSGTYGHISSKL